MKIKITESQYKKIFLSGRYENLILEQAPVKVLDTFLDDISVITKYSGKTAAKNFATDFPDDVLRKIEREFNVPTSTIKNFDDFKSVLKSVSDNPINSYQFQSLLKINNPTIREKLLLSLSKDDGVHRILALYKKAETAGRNDVTQPMRERLKIYLGTEDEVSNFINKYKSGVTSKIEDLTYSLDDELFDMFKSIQNEEQFLKLKNEATSLLRNVDLTGSKLFKDTKQYGDFLKAKELFKMISGEKSEFAKFKQFIEKNKIDVDLLKSEIKRKDPNLFSKILSFSDSIYANTKSVGKLFIIILVISLATGLGIVGYKIYNYFKGSGGSIIGGSDDKVTTEFKNKILDKELSSIIVDGKLINLSVGDKNLNRDGILNKELVISTTPMDSKGIEYQLTVSSISINGEIYQNTKIIYNTKDKTYTIKEKGNVSTQEDIKNLKDEGNTLKYNALEKTNYISKEFLTPEYITFEESKFNDKTTIYEGVIQKDFKSNDSTFKQGEHILWYVVLWDNVKKSWVAKKVDRNSSGDITKIY